jgi:hypothetical protein
MMVRNLCVSGFVTACALALPAVATAQLPNDYKTPGATVKASSAQICSVDFASKAKPDAGWQQTEALERYGVRAQGFSGDLDHLIPVSLGGSNDPDNLWPFHAQGEFTLDAKNALAAKLRDMVCAGKISLKDAQDAFKKDWTKAYRTHMSSLNAPGQ